MEEIESLFTSSLTAIREQGQRGKICSSAGLWRKTIDPMGDLLCHLLLFPLIHVIGMIDHCRVYAARSARLALNQCFKLLKIRLCSHIIVCTVKSKQWAMDLCDSRVWRLDSEKILVLCRLIRNIQQGRGADERGKGTFWVA